MLVKSVSPSIKDVFLGHSWATWVRVDLDSKKIIKSNCTIKPQLFQTILSKLHK